jgi:hypothetical protein
LKNIFTYEEAVQECGVCFAYCTQLYASANGGKVDNDKWFMSLFKLCLMCHFNDHARMDKRKREMEIDLAALPTGEEAAQGESFLYAALSQASAELKTFLVVLQKAPAEFTEILLRDSRDDSAWSRRINRLVGTKNVNTNIIGELRQILGA